MRKACPLGTYFMLEKIKTRLASPRGARGWCALIALAAILATLVFIFSNSARSREESSEQSESFKEIAEIFIPEDTSFGKWVLDNIRKIAHFTEYGLLGFETAVLVSAVAETRRKRLMSGGVSSLFALCTAFFDETVQIFSERGPSVSDMWIDVGGFLVYAALTYIGVELLFFISKRIRAKCGTRSGA